ncbi:MAG: hypothetical protein FJZ01_08260 [Candidatus Sericytochromatia bacterium]|nr:hypothetical protein [Candidatus Tanganyikabacteria bacterium]
MTRKDNTPAILIHVDGLICDYRQRQVAAETPNYWWPSKLLDDDPVEGALDLLWDLSKIFRLAYLLARPHKSKVFQASIAWLVEQAFPGGYVLIGETPDDRVRTVTDAKDEFGVNIVLAVGTDNEEAKVLRRLGIATVSLKAFEPDFGKVRKFIRRSEWADTPPRAVELLKCACCGEEYPEEGFARIDFYGSRARRPIRSIGTTRPGTPC